MKRAGRIPDAWRRSRTVLIYKGGEKEDISNWRPIALTPTLYKLYAGLWAKRFSAWAERHHVLSPAQKGFRPFDGVLEHNYVLQQQIRHIRAGRRDLCLALLDLENAFGSVPHGALGDSLTAAGTGEDFKNLVQDIYRDNSTRYLSAQGPTAPIAAQRGIRQGCPLSGAL